jgi:hypothetical protein
MSGIFKTRKENVGGLGELETTLAKILRIIQSYECFASPRSDSIEIPVEISNRVMRFKE